MEPGRNRSYCFLGGYFLYRIRALILISSVTFPLFEHHQYLA